MVITSQRLLLWMMMILFFVYYFGSHDSSTYSNFEEDDEFESLQLEPVAHIKRNATLSTPISLQQFLDHSSIIARIANGISLQSGLMNGSIPIDAAVSELLNFGNVKVSDVANFKSDNVKALAEKLKGLPSSLDASTKDLEKNVTAWSKLIMDLDGVKDVMKNTEKDKYYEELGEFEKEFQYNLLSEATGSVVKMLTRLTEIETEAEKDHSKTSQNSLETIFDDSFRSFIKFNTTVIQKLTTLKALSTTIDKYKMLKESEGTFKPIREAIRIQNHRQSLSSQFSQQEIDSIKSSFQKVVDLAATSSESLPQTQLLNSLANSRSHPNLQPRRFTSAFYKGVSELKQLGADVRSDSIDSIPLSPVADALKPLLNFKNQLAEIDKKLEPMASSQGSLENLRRLLGQINTMNQTSLSSVDVIKEFEKCESKMLFQFTESLKIIGTAKDLSDLLVRTSDAITKIDVKTLDEQSKTFIDSLGFDDMKDAQKSATQVPKVLETLKKTNSLATFKAVIEKIKGDINVNVTELKVDIQLITGGKNTVNSFTGLKEELAVHTCLRKLKPRMDLVAHGIQTTRGLQTLDASKIQELEKVVTTISVVSKDFSGLSLKSEVKQSTREINKLENPLNTVSIIGESVNALRNANELKKLDSSIQSLKSIGVRVDQEMGAVKDGNIQKKVKDNWGDHTKDMASLEASLSKIRDFEKTLNSDSLKALGKPFLALQNLPDANIKTKNKIQALESLIPTSQNPSELVESKKTLEHLDSLDLQFSSHKSSFRGAPQAFQDLYDFLVGFSTVLQASPERQGPGRAPPVIILGDNKVEATTPNYYMIGGFSTLGVFVIAIGLGVIIYLVKRYKKIKKLKKYAKKKLCFWIRDQVFMNDAPDRYYDAYRWHESMMRTMEIQVGREDKKESTDYLPLRKQRGHFYCNPQTALRHLTMDGCLIPIHANYVESPNGKKFIATQAPMRKTEHKTNPKDDTRQDFWHMCMAENVEHIVMLCALTEIKDELYFPEKIKDVTLTFGRYQVRTLSEKPVKNTKWLIKVREIEVVDTKKEFPTRIFKHFNFNGWPDQKTPHRGDYDEVCWIMKQLETTNTPAVVHCIGGVGRTMTFIGIHTTVHGVKSDYKLTMLEELTRLRRARWGAVQTIRQSYYLQMVVCNKLNDDYKLEMGFYCENIFNSFNKVAVEKVLPPEAAAVREEQKKVKEAGGTDDEIIRPKTDADFGTYIMF